MAKKARVRISDETLVRAVCERARDLRAVIKAAQDADLLVELPSEAVGFFNDGTDAGDPQYWTFQRSYAP